MCCRYLAAFECTGSASTRPGRPSFFNALCMGYNGFGLYVVSIDSAKAMAVMMGNEGISYLRSYFDIQRFGKIAGLSSSVT